MGQKSEIPIEALNVIINIYICRINTTYLFLYEDGFGLIGDGFRFRHHNIFFEDDRYRN